MSEKLSNSKTPKLKRDSLITRSYLANVERSGINVDNPIKTVRKRRNLKNKNSAINIVTEKAKITLSSPKGENLAANDVQNILNDTQEMKEYKVVTEQEFTFISDLNKKEKMLIKHIKRNNNAINNSTQQIDKIQREMEQKVRELILTLQQQIEIVVENIKDKVKLSQNQIENETKNMYKSLEKYQNIKLQIKNNVNQPVESWEKLKRRSIDLIQDTKSKSSMNINNETIKSVEHIHVNNNINWDNIVTDFTANIKDNINIIVKFQNISLNHNAEQNQIKVNESNNLVPTENTQLITQHDIEDIDQDIKEIVAENNIKQEILETNEKRDPIETLIICFTREGNIHCCNLNIDIEPEIKINDAVWNFAPNEHDAKFSNKSITTQFENNHHVKYPSIVKQPNTDYIYRFGGVLDGKQLNCAERYDYKQHKWTKLHPTPIARQDAISLMLNNENIITLGGAAKVITSKINNQRDSIVELNRNNIMREWEFYKHVSIYNIYNDSWICSEYNNLLCCMNEARYGFCGLNIPNDNKIMVFGGNGPNGRSKTVELFDYNNNQWIYLNDLPINKARHGCCWYNDQIIIAGGDIKSESEKCFIFDLQQSQWRELPKLNQVHDRPIIKSYDDKSCVVIYGNDSYKLSSFEILDERMNEYKWILTNIDNHPINVEFRAGLVAC